jgi:pimeloyl-ACP methyl ester carboxylesterase
MPTEESDRMTHYVTTSEGARIAYDRAGHGEPLILVGGAGQFRAVDKPTKALTDELAQRGFDVVHYDRPGRGDSGGESPFTLAGEVAAVQALIDLLGGRASLYGSSSGGVIALAAAATLPGVDRLILWEVPLDDDNGSEGAELLAAVEERLEVGDREGALRHFMDGMPPEWFEAMRSGPQWPLFEHMAPTVRADAEALAWSQSAPHSRLWSKISAPTVVLVGAGAFPFFFDAADAIVDTLPDARRADIPGAGHGWQPNELADAIALEATRSRRTF